MCEMQRVVYAVLLHYFCSVVLLLQPANHLLWLVIVEYNALFMLHYVQFGYTVQLDYNFKKTRMRNYTRTTRTAKISWRVCEYTRN